MDVYKDAIRSIDGRCVARNTAQVDYQLIKELLAYIVDSGYEQV